MSAAQAGKQDLYGPGASPRGRSFFSPAQSVVLLMLCSLPLLAGLISYRLHPGLAAPDELYTAGWIRLVLDGHWPFPTFRSGFLSNLILAAWSMLAPGKELWLQLPPGLALAAEIFLIARLTAGLAGAESGLAAAALSAVSAFSQLRSRTILAFHFLPLGLLLLLLLLPWALQRRSRATAWGGLCALGLLQYEAWVAAMLVLGLALFWGLRKRDGAWPWALAGMAIGTLTVFGTWPYASDYFIERAALNTFGLQGSSHSPFGALTSFFVGRPNVEELGAWPLFPFWALPLLLAGLWKTARWWPFFPAWALLGLLPMAAAGDGFQARRAIISLPAIFCIAGLGLGPLLKRHPRKVLALLLLGAAAESLALDRALTQRDLATFSPARRAAAVASRLQELEKGPALLCTSVSGDDTAPFNFYLPRSSSTGTLWVLVPGTYTFHQPDPALGAWHAVRVEGSGPYYWLRAKAEDRQIWSERQELGIALHLALFKSGKSRAIAFAHERLLAASDPWQRTQCLEALTRFSTMLGNIDEATLRALMQEPLVSTSPLLVAAAWLAPHDPRRALEFARHATTLDPRRSKAWLLQAMLEAQMGQADLARRSFHLAKLSDQNF